MRIDLTQDAAGYAIIRAVSESPRLVVMLKRPQLTSHITLGKIIVVSICVCVFLFAFQAKLAQYEGPPVSITPIKAAKLWDGDHRLQVPTLTELTGYAILILPWLLLVGAPGLVRQQRSIEHPAPCLYSGLWHAPLFFRPPPVQ